MSKSDTAKWTGGVAMTIPRATDSAEGCDSTSDDGVQYLSAEEKACLSFLEETIESLDMEEESQPSNDRAESFSTPGHVATRTAHLSDSLDQSKHKDVLKHYSNDTKAFGSVAHSQILNCLVPTPLVLANSSAYVPPKPETAAYKEKLPAELETAHESDKPSLGCKNVPSEVNMVVLPPPAIVKNGSERDREKQDGLWSKCASPHGHLSNECVAKKNKCEKQISNKNAPPEAQVSIQPKESQSSALSYPAVAPKPRNIPSHIAIFSHKGTTSPRADSNIRNLSTSPGSRGLMTPDKVRLEALCKLGLLKEKESEVKSSTNEGCQAKSQTSYSDLSQSRPLSPHTSAGKQGLTGQTSQGSMSDLTTAPSQPHHGNPGVGKASALERSGMGLGNCMSSYMFSDCQTSCRTGITPLSSAKAKVPAQLPASPPVPHKLSHASGRSILMEPRMGDDRQEALRKLGLLKS